MQCLPLIISEVHLSNNLYLYYAWECSNILLYQGFSVGTCCDLVMVEQNDVGT